MTYTILSARYANAEGTAVIAQTEEAGAVAYSADTPGWADLIASGVEIAAYAAPPLSLADYQRAVETHVEATAQAKGYKSDVSCASHVASTVAAWKAEAEAFVAWRDAVWTTTFAALAAWQGGGEAPTIEGLIASLPAIEWPS